MTEVLSSTTAKAKGLKDFDIYRERRGGADFCVLLVSMTEFFFSKTIRDSPFAGKKSIFSSKSGFLLFST